MYRVRAPTLRDPVQGKLYRNVVDQMQCNHERGCREIDTGQLGLGIITEA